MSRAALQNQSFLGHQSAYPGTMKQPAGRGGDEQRPSRLLQMRDDYQRRLLKEKEEKLVGMYEDSYRKNMERVERVARGASANGAGAYPNSKLRQPGHLQSRQAGAGQMGSTPSVRDFFRERRDMEAKGSYVPPINHHYKQTKSRTGSGNSYHKNSAGVDRAQPLAPIQARHKGVNSAPTQPTPFSSKPRLVKHNASSPETDENDNYYKPPANPRGSPKRVPGPARAPAAARGAKRSPGPTAQRGEEKLSDFQKWQMEQNRAREDRLKKLNMRAPPSGRGSGDWGGKIEYEEEEEEEEEGEGGQNEELERQQRELMQRIAQQQAELDRLRKEREEEEELERQEAEMLRKQEAADRERRRRQQQEEARQRREEEALARREEEEQRKAARAARQERQRFEAHPDRYDSNSSNGYADASQPSTQRSSYRGGYGGSEQTTPRYNPRPPPDPTPRKPAQQRRQPPPQRRPPTPEEEDPIPVPGPGNEIYLQAADDEKGVKLKLVPCKLCGRKFADDRIQKHQAACKNAQKKRKVFDPTQMRTGGTDMAKYISKGAHKNDPPKKKKVDWRRQHEEFINNIRYAKQMQVMEQQGVAAKDLPPPPPSHNPDLVPCPHCGRTFNDLAAERHIPRCQELKTRPAANRRR